MESFNVPTGVELLPATKTAVQCAQQETRLQIMMVSSPSALSWQGKQVLGGDAIADRIRLRYFERHFPNRKDNEHPQKGMELYILNRRHPSDMEPAVQIIETILKGGEYDEGYGENIRQIAADLTRALEQALPTIRIINNWESKEWFHQ